MSYGLKLTDFEKVGDTNISLKILDADHHKLLLLPQKNEQEFINAATAGIKEKEIIEQLSEKFRKPENTPVRIYLAIVTTEFVGIITIGYVDVSKYGFASSWWIHSIWVQTEHSGKGVGSAALQLIVNHLQKINPAEIRANIHMTNYASLRIFEKAGFKKSFEEEGGHGFFAFKPLGTP